MVVGSVIACGGCWYCRTEQYSLCDNSNPQPVLPEKLWGHAPAGIFGYSHAAGGFSGSHAEYVRVPFADIGAFPIPEQLADDTAVFASDAVPTGWMAADMCQLRGGVVVAVWGAGAVGQMAARAAQLLGAGRVIVIDRFQERLTMAAERIGAETLDYSTVDVMDALREMTAGRGPDACIEAVGMEAHGSGIAGAYDKAKHLLRLQTDRPTAVREAIMACRKGGTVSIVGVFGGFVDKFPLGAAMNKALTLRMGQMHAQRYIPMLLERMRAGDIDTSHLATHPMPLEQGALAYQMFEKKTDGCVRAVLHPDNGCDHHGRSTRTPTTRRSARPGLARRCQTCARPSRPTPADKNLLPCATHFRGSHQCGVLFSQQVAHEPCLPCSAGNGQ